MRKVIFSPFKKTLFILLSCLLSYSNTLAETNLEYAVKSAVALNFARFTEWPNNPATTMLKFCLLADPSVLQAFTILDKKAVGHKNLEVIKIPSANDLEGCHLLYIAENYSSHIKQIRSESIARHILTIGESADFLENGGMVNLEMDEGKIILQINLNLVQQAKLQISARVLKLATIINF